MLLARRNESLAAVLRHALDGIEAGQGKGKAKKRK